MAWIARGFNGNVQDGSDGQTPAVPAVATHRGELWCLWSDAAGDLYYAVGDNDTFQARKRFPDQGIPVLAELLGTLHAIVVKSPGDLAHYVFDDQNQQWAIPAMLDSQAGFVAHSTPAFYAFHNKLVLVFIQNNSLYYSIWSVNPRDDTSVWTPPQEVSGIKQVTGIPALFVLQGVLHCICESNDDSREILGFAYSPAENVWNTSHDVSEGKAAQGVSATSYGDSAFMAFQENGPSDTSHSIFISEFKNGEWQPHEAIDGQTSSDPPQLAVLHGRINCIFNANDDSKDLKWYSKPLLNFSLDSWMQHVPDETLLSAMTIPGTHDTCARSDIPFVRTQYLDVTKQLQAGLRFLDLRCRADSKGELYLYHGGIPINLPMYLSLHHVMKEVFDHMDQNPSETVLISINNDDVSGKESPSVFYNAVKDFMDKTPRYANGHPRWNTSQTTVTLGEARGKAVLLRRYHPDLSVDASELLGIDLSGWLNDNPDFTLQTDSGMTATLQDKWKYSEIIPLHSLIENKLAFVTTMLQKAAAAPPEHWFLNFMSCVGDPAEKGEIAESHWIAVGAHTKIIGAFVHGMNTQVRRTFDIGVKTRYGIIAMDYPELPKDSDLIAWFIGTNM